MKRWLIGVPLVGAVVVAAFATMSSDAAEPTVSHAAVIRGNIVETVGASGTLQAVTTVQVGTQVSGIVQELYADFNSIVKKGEIIARLDPSSINAQVEAARANLARAEADVERLTVALEDARAKAVRSEKLAAQGILPQADLETAQVTVKSADAQLRSARAAVMQAAAALGQHLVSLQHTVIRAPIDGLVISRDVDRGQTVAASMSAPTLFVLAADLTKMQVVANVDESDVGRLRPGQAVTFSVDAYPAETFDGQVIQIRLQPIVTSNVVSYAAVIEVPNPDLKLKPGMTANVTIEVIRRDNVLLVPNAALRFRPSQATYEALGGTPPNERTAPAGRALRVEDGEDAPPAEPLADREAPRTAETFDALFGPLEPIETNGRVWTFDRGELRAVAVRLGISDGQRTELIAGDVSEGVEVVTAVTTGESTTRPPASAGGLFMPGGAASGRMR
jgi:HlyD family secretion protein